MAPNPLGPAGPCLGKFPPNHSVCLFHQQLMPAIVDAHPVDYLSFSPRFLRQLTAQSPDQLAGLAVRGDSMEPTLSHGDHILVDLSCAAPTIDGVYVVRMDQSLLVKRLQIDLGSRRVTVISDNKKYAIINDVERDAIQVVGRVIWLSRRI